MGQRARSQRDQIEQQVNEKRDELNRLRSAPVYPSIENIRKLQDERIAVETAYKSLQEVVNRGEIETRPSTTRSISSIDCAAYKPI